MKAKTSLIVALLLGSIVSRAADAQLTAPAPDAAEKEKLYAEAIEKRADRVLKSLDGMEATKLAQVHDVVISQYRALRTRDTAIDILLGTMGKATNYANRESFLLVECKPLHDQFVAKLGSLLTPEQVEKVKDQMTYNKAKNIYNSYLTVAPDLAETDKARIMEELKMAREEALDGGSAPEKAEIFQKYQDRINEYLAGKGHDVKAALKDLEAKLEAEKKPAAPAAKPAEKAN